MYCESRILFMHFGESTYFSALSSRHLNLDWITLLAILSIGVILSHLPLLFLLHILILGIIAGLILTLILR